MWSNLVKNSKDHDKTGRFKKCCIFQTVDDKYSINVTT